MVIFHSYVKLPEGTILFDDGFLSPTLSNLKWFDDGANEFSSITLWILFNWIQRHEEVRYSCIMLLIHVLVAWQHGNCFAPVFSVPVLCWYTSHSVPMRLRWICHGLKICHVPFIWPQIVVLYLYHLVPPCSDPRIILLANYPMIKYHKSTWSCIVPIKYHHKMLAVSICYTIFLAETAARIRAACCCGIATPGNQSCTMPGVGPIGKTAKSFTEQGRGC